MGVYVDYESHLAELERSLNPEEQRNYKACKDAVRGYITEKNLHKVRSYIDFLDYYAGNKKKEFKPLHKIVNLHQAKFGNTEESDKADDIIHKAIYDGVKDGERYIPGKRDEIIDYLKTEGGFEYSPISDRLRRFIGLMGRDRKFKPTPLAEWVSMFAKGFYTKEFYKEAYDWCSNWLRYQLSVKEYRDIKVLTRKKADGAVEAAVWYDIEKKDGHIFQTVAFFPEIDEKDLEYSIPGGPAYGLNKVVSKGEIKMVGTTVLSAYAAEKIPIIKSVISNYPLLDWLTKNLSLFSSPTEGISLLIAGLAAKKAISGYYDIKAKRDFVKKFARDCDTADMIRIYSEVADYDSMKASICYSILWKNTKMESVTGDDKIPKISLNRGLNADDLWERAKGYGIYKKADVRRYLDIFEKELHIAEKRVVNRDGKVAEKYVAKKNVYEAGYPPMKNSPPMENKELEGIVEKLEKELYLEKTDKALVLG